MKSITNKPDFTRRTLSLGKVPCYQYCKSLKDELKDGVNSSLSRVTGFPEPLICRLVRKVLLLVQMPHY